MARRSFLPFVFVAAGCHVRPESLLPASVGRHAPQPSELLRASPVTFVAVGDSTSFAWPALLQELLDAHAGKSGLYRVENAAVKTRAPLEGLGASGRPMTEAPETAGAPRVALCLVSLRGIGDERGPVKSENDMVGAEMGADALEQLARELQSAGIERVVFATPLYVGDAGPELELERVALERLLSRGLPFVEAGPDICRASRRYFPDAYAADQTHPNEFGTKLLAEEWYRWLAGAQADEEALERLYAEDQDVERLEAAQAALRP